MTPPAQKPAKHAEHVQHAQHALLSVYHKKDLLPLAQDLHALSVRLYATQGTTEYLTQHKLPCQTIESLTQYPPLLGGRVKVLHPMVFGGILYERDNPAHLEDVNAYHLPSFDIVVTDLYPFEQALAAGKDLKGMIELIDIGGVSLLRAAAKNYAHVSVMTQSSQYASLIDCLKNQQHVDYLAQRKKWAQQAFALTTAYDKAIAAYLSDDVAHGIGEKEADTPPQHVVLRYGENPHQKAYFEGDMEGLFTKHQGKELSYNNLLDMAAALELLEELPALSSQPICVIVKHNIACGVGLQPSVRQAFETAYQTDSMSAFGGIFVTNACVDVAVAQFMSELFFEVLIAPDYEEEALHILQKKKTRIILTQKRPLGREEHRRSALGGRLVQSPDTYIVQPQDMEVVTYAQPDATTIEALRLAHALVKHGKSNAIALAKANKMMGIGTGQVSRIDALRIALQKAKTAEHSVQNACMASEAFFPFPDCVQEAHQAGVTAVIQPGGSKNDQSSIDYCNTHGVCMIFTHKRHFKH